MSTTCSYVNVKSSQRCTHTIVRGSTLCRKHKYLLKGKQTEPAFSSSEIKESKEETKVTVDDDLCSIQDVQEETQEDADDDTVRQYIYSIIDDYMRHYATSHIVERSSVPAHSSSSSMGLDKLSMLAIPLIPIIIKLLSRHINIDINGLYQSVTASESSSIGGSREGTSTEARAEAEATTEATHRQGPAPAKVVDELRTSKIRV